MITATESICPSGWSLPSKKQVDFNRSVSQFLPVLGGNYGRGQLYNESSFGGWWGSEPSSSMSRYMLSYSGNSLYTNNSYRGGGFYIRCVSEEKTVLDLTYMQDMTRVVLRKQ